MSLDKDKGNLMLDFSGTLIPEENGNAPQTKVAPTERFVDRIYKIDPRGLSLGTYYEEVFRGKTLWSPHRYVTPPLNALKRMVGVDVWHVLDRDEIQVADVSRASAKSLKGLQGYYLDEQEADDIRAVKDKFNIVGGTGILYIDRLAAFAVMGRQGQELLDAAIFNSDLEDTGLEGKLIIGHYLAVNAPNVSLVAREDCKLTAVALTAVAKKVSLVPTKDNIYRNDEEVVSELMDFQLMLPPNLRQRVDLGKILHGRLTRVLES